ncbi:hypothetical protein [Pseudomonas sp.]|uniref:hypothetical protein n=1 Tax=Pseudomonas sp. TaxID=306 RepID=UPI0026046347|nr:hypothetical protein [Pseudomonas sp.]
MTNHHAQSLPASLTPRDAMLLQLDRRLQAAVSPSEWVNGLQAAITLNQHAHEQIQALYAAAPTLNQVLREQLHTALTYDPDQVEWKAAQQPQITLTQAVANYLHGVAVPADINSRITLKWASAADDEAFPLTPAQVLTHFQALGMPTRYNTSVRDYWAAIAAGQSVSRGDYAGQLRRTLIRTQVTLAQACGQLSDEGAKRWRQVIDAPSQLERQQAGAGPAEREISEIAWGNGNGSSVTFKGAFVVHARDTAQDPCELLFVPGLGLELFEYASRAALVAQLQRWTGSDTQPGWLLWQLLAYHSRSVLYEAGKKRTLDRLVYTPVSEDIFQHSARASFSTQHSNELLSAVMVSPALQNGASTLLAQDTSGVALSYAQALEQWRGEIASKGLPAEQIEAVAALVRRDARWHAGDITFGSLAVEIALRIRQEKIQVQEHALLQLLDPLKLTQESAPFNQFLESQLLLQAERDRAVTHVKDLTVERELENPDVLTLDRDGGSHQRALIAIRGLAIHHEGQLQQWQKQLSEAEFRALSQALKLNIAGADSTSSLRTVGVSIGPPDQAFLLAGVVVITAREALLAPSTPATTLLFVPGVDGGLAAFTSLKHLQEQIGKTLTRYPQSALWMTVALEEQVAARAWVNELTQPSSLAIQWLDIPIGFVEYSVKSQIKAHRKTLSAIKKRSFIVQGLQPITSLRLLGLTTSMLLQVPEHAARELAIENVAIQRQAQALKEQCMTVIGTLSETAQEAYASQLRVISESTLAVERYLATHLPSLTAFAVQKLHDQFIHDGFGQDLDPQQVMFGIPDSVKVIKTFSPPKAIIPEIEVGQIPLDYRDYSLLQLALMNIDMTDPQTALRLKHMHVRHARWKSRLTPDYLGRTIPALDVAGAYEREVTRVFFGPASASDSFSAMQPENSVLTQLMSRPHRQALELQLWLSRQQGLSEAALTLFSCAIRARTVADLHAEGMSVEIGQVVLSSFVEHYGWSSLDQIRVIRDKRSGMTLLYLPDFPEGKNLQVYTSLALANAALTGMANTAAHMKYVAEHVKSNEDVAGVQKYLADGAAFVPTEWLESVFTSEADLAWSLSLERPERLIRTVNLVSRTNARLLALRNERDTQQTLDLIASGMALVPGLNLISDVYFITRAATALSQTHDLLDRVMLAAHIVMCVADIIVTIGGAVLPAPGAEGAEVAGIAEVADTEGPTSVPLALPQVHLQSLNARRALSQSGWAAQARPAQARVSAQVLFKSFEIDRSPQGATALSGQYDRGSYLSEGVQFIVHKGKTYNVGRPKNAQALHLRDPVTGTFGPPVRQGVNAEWHLAAGYGLPGGMKPAVEYLLEGGMSLEVAQGILADYDFPAGSGLEQLFAIQIKITGVKPVWGDKFRAQTPGPSAGSSQPRPVSVPLIEELEAYALVPSVSPRPSPGTSAMDSVVIGDREIFIGREANGDGFYPLYEWDSQRVGQLTPSGRLSAEGIYHMDDEAGQMDFISINGAFFQAYYNQIINRLTVIRPGGRVQDGLVVEPQGAFRRMGQWQLAPAPAADMKVRLDNLSRQLLPPPVSDEQRLRYVSLYGFQLIKRIVPELRLARTVPEQDALAMEFSYRHGQPVDTLIKIFDARLKGEGLPEGLPVYDEIQGLTPLMSSAQNQLNVNESFKRGNYTIVAPTSVQEIARRDAMRSTLESMEKLQPAHMKEVNTYLRDLLVARGYEALGPEVAGVFSRNIFRQVYRGPNGEIYLVAVKVLGIREGSNVLRGIGMHSTVHGRYMSDGWVETTIEHEMRAHPANPLLQTLRDALESGRLYKVLAGVSRKGEILIFRM